jgi:hypothetical protein
VLTGSRVTRRSVIARAIFPLVLATLRDEATMTELRRQGLEVMGGTPAELAATLHAELEKQRLQGETPYKYSSNGLIARTGVKARYYFMKRLGFMGMATVFANRTITEGVKDNTVGNNYGTTIRGWAIEFGPCYRFF